MIVFSIICLTGESGLGKSTLVNSLFLTDLYKERKLPSVQGKPMLYAVLYQHKYIISNSLHERKDISKTFSVISKVNLLPLIVSVLNILISITYQNLRISEFSINILTKCKMYVCLYNMSLNIYLLVYLLNLLI